MNSPIIAPQGPRPDEFGLDRDYIERWSNTLFHFLCKYYWRIETLGLENVPQNGRAILVGNHRGFIPFDAIMTLHLVLKNTGRIPRFLVHPGLLKFRPIAKFITRFGGVLACRENAARILDAEELLGILPEGVEGAFSLYRDAYKLLSFGRDDFVKMSLRHRAPIVPYVIVGSADALPIFARIGWRCWKKRTLWPYLPIAMPMPMPAKWHMRFLAPINVHQDYPPEAARDRTVVKAISLKVRTAMQGALDEMLARRLSIFWGSIFKSDNS